jgi:hypothetical protein
VTLEGWKILLLRCATLRADRVSLASPQRDEWDSYRSILDQLSDKDTREDYGIKKSSLATVRTTIDELRQSGVSLSDLEGDLDLVTQKLIELKPELERQY